MALNAKTDPNYVPKRINGKFAPGWSGNPGGSLEATRRSFNRDFLLALAADFKKHGAAAIEKVRKTQPAAYMKICALLVPRELQVEHSGGVKAMSDEQIETAIEAIKAMLEARACAIAQVQAQAQPTDARGRHGGGAERAQAGERQGAIATGRVIPLYKRVGRAVTRAERNRRPRYRHRRAPRRQMIDKAPVGTAVGMHPPVRPRFGSVWVIHSKFRRAWQAIV